MKLLYIGKNFNFITKNSYSSAVIIEIQDRYVKVLIDGKVIRLLDKEKLIHKFEEAEQEKKSKNTCRNCMELKNGNCFGSLQICDDFKPTPEMSKEDLDRWPKKGTVSRSKSDKYIIREHDFMNENNDTDE